MNLLVAKLAERVGSRSIESYNSSGMNEFLYGKEDNAKNGDLESSEAMRRPTKQSRQIELSSVGTLKVDPEGSEALNAASVRANVSAEYRARKCMYSQRELFLRFSMLFSAFNIFLALDANKVKEKVLELKKKFWEIESELLSAFGESSSGYILK